MGDDREEQRRLALKRLEVLDGLVTALDAPHELLELMLGSADTEVGRAAIRERWGLSEVQASAVMDAQVRRFTRLEVERIRQQRAETLEWLDQLDRESD